MVEEMTSLCGDLAYSNVYMKKKVLEHFEGNVIITEMNGKQNVVTFKSSAHKFYTDFTAEQTETTVSVRKWQSLKLQVNW